MQRTVKIWTVVGALAAAGCYGLMVMAPGCGSSNLPAIEDNRVKLTDEDMPEYVKDPQNSVEMRLANSLVTDKGLAPLAQMKKVQTLELRRCDVGDAGMEYVKGLTSLEVLDLAATHVTDAGVAKLKDLKNLKTLNLHALHGFTDKGLKELYGLTNLRDLVVTGTSVTDEGLQDIQKKLKKIRVIPPSKTMPTAEQMPNAPS